MVSLEFINQKITLPNIPFIDFLDKCPDVPQFFVNGLYYVFGCVVQFINFMFCAPSSMVHTLIEGTGNWYTVYGFLNPNMSHVNPWTFEIHQTLLIGNIRVENPLFWLIEIMSESDIPMIVTVVFLGVSLVLIGKLIKSLLPI